MFEVTVKVDSTLVSYYGIPKFCAGENQCGAHWTCDKQGRKVCLSGWTGVDCNTVILGGKGDCEVYTGTRTV